MSEAKEKPSEVLAVAVNFVHTIADGQQLSFGTAFNIDATFAQKAAVLDELQDLAKRSAGRAKRPKILEDLRKHREVLAQFIEDAGLAEARWPAVKQELADRIAELNSDAYREKVLTEVKEAFETTMATLESRKAEEHNRGAEAWAKSGNRIGDYKPRGNVERNIALIEADQKKAREAAAGALEAFEHQRLIDVDAAEKALAKAEAERDAVIQNYDHSVKRYNQAIEVLEEELAEIDALLKD